MNQIAKFLPGVENGQVTVRPGTSSMYHSQGTWVPSSVARVLGAPGGSNNEVRLLPPPSPKVVTWSDTNSPIFGHAPDCWLIHGGKLYQTHIPCQAFYIVKGRNSYFIVYKSDAMV